MLRQTDLNTKMTTSMRKMTMISKPTELSGAEMGACRLDIHENHRMKTIMMVED
jgi:hypothetical protein